MDQEIALRKEAVRLWLSGENKAEIGRQLNKSRGWVQYWIGEYDPDRPDSSLQNKSRAPKEPHCKWPEAIRQQALESRRRRMTAELPGYEYALIGADAIHYELAALGVIPTPHPRTIHYWIKEAGLISEADVDTVKEKAGPPYPTPNRSKVNELHQLDLKGPFYLSDSKQKHYLLALRDFRSKGVALDVSQNKQSRTVAGFLVAAWQRRGVPKVLQMDNGLEFRGSNRYPRSFGIVVRLCLDLGVEPLFIPPREPWRNGLIENLNGQIEQLFLEREHFASFVQLQTRIIKLEQARNTTHRLPALEGQTPNEFMADHSLQFLPEGYDGL